MKMVTDCETLKSLYHFAFDFTYLSFTMLNNFPQKSMIIPKVISLSFFFILHYNLNFPFFLICFYVNQMLLKCFNLSDLTIIVLSTDLSES